MNIEEISFLIPYSDTIPLYIKRNSWIIYPSISRFCWQLPFQNNDKEKRNKHAISWKWSQKASFASCTSFMALILQKKNKEKKTEHAVSECTVCIQFFFFFLKKNISQAISIRYSYRLIAQDWFITSIIFGSGPSIWIHHWKYDAYFWCNFY